MKYLLYLLLLLPLLASSCKKDVPACETITDVPPAFLAYWQFPAGSWWVYQLAGSRPAVYDTVRAIGAGRVYNERGQGGAGPNASGFTTLGSNTPIAPIFPALPAGGAPRRC